MRVCGGADKKRQLEQQFKDIELRYGWIKQIVDDDKLIREIDAIRALLGSGEFIPNERGRLEDQITQLELKLLSEDERNNIFQTLFRMGVTENNLIQQFEIIQDVYNNTMRAIECFDTMNSTLRYMG